MALRGDRSSVPQRPEGVDTVRRVPRWLDRSAIRPSQARNRALNQVSGDLLAGGMTHHSAEGDTMAYLLTVLEDAGVPYTITACPGRGYQIKTEKPSQRQVGDASAAVRGASPRREV